MSPERPPTRRSRLPLLLLPALLAAALIAAAVYRFTPLLSTPRFHGTPYDPPEAAADFTLTEHTGRPLSLRELRGRTVLLFFGYTHCPDVCPLTLSTLRRSLDSLGADPEEVRVLLVTVDPARDTPEALARYVARFGPGVSGLTGDPAALAALRRAYAVHSEPGAAGHGGVMHTSAVFGIDRRGRIRVLLRPEAPSEELRQDLRTLLRL